jgi:catechol 2,3-dioxygenase-like lactoylglutathione lyase family enzyme
MKAEMDRRALKNVRPDGGRGWISDDPAGYMLNTWVPIKDPAMFPGAAKPCAVADSKECKEAYEAGHKNLASVPKPSGKGFNATAFSNVVLNIKKTDMAKEREFYQNLLGMKLIHESPTHTILRFGPNALVLDATVDPGEKPYCNHFGLQIDNFDAAKVEAELKRRGLNPKPYTRLAWTVMDPDGLRVEVAGAGLAELMAKEGVPK